MRVESESLFGIRIDLHDYPGLDRVTAHLLAERTPAWITAPHFHILLLARREPVLRDLLNASAVNYIDGIGTWLALRVLHNGRIPRINGTDYHSSILHASLAQGKRVFLLGGHRDTAAKLRTRLETVHPGAALEIHHGEIALEDDTIPAAINAFQPDLLFLGLGTPFQFTWLARYHTKLDVPVTFATGAFLDFAAGTHPRAPRWMRHLGLEWLHRLLHEPRRLWRRYLLGIPVFAWLVMVEKFRRTIRRGG